MASPSDNACLGPDNDARSPKPKIRPSPGSTRRECVFNHTSRMEAVGWLVAVKIHGGLCRVPRGGFGTSRTRPSRGNLHVKFCDAMALTTARIFLTRCSSSGVHQVQMLVSAIETWPVDINACNRKCLKSCRSLHDSAGRQNPRKIPFVGFPRPSGRTPSRAPRFADIRPFRSPVGLVKKLLNLPETTISGMIFAAWAYR